MIKKKFGGKRKMDNDSIIGFCKMNANNQITVPKIVRDKFGIEDLEDGQTIMLEVKFIKVIKPTEEKRRGK